MKILLIAFERESIPIGQLAKRLIEEGHDVYIYNTDHWYVSFSKNGMDDYYVNDCNVDRNKVFNISTLLEDINNCDPNIGQDDVDWQFISEFEKKYLGNRPLSKILSTDTIFYRVFHHRNIYFNPTNKNLYYKLVELIARSYEKIIEQVQPDFYFSICNQYALKYLWFEIAKKNQKEFLTFFTGRVAQKWIVSDNFHIGTTDSIMKLMEHYEVINHNPEAGLAFIKEIKENLKPVYSDHEKILALQRSFFSVPKRIISIFRNAFSFMRLFLKGDIKKYRHFFQKDFFDVNIISLFKLELKSVWRMRQYRADSNLNLKNLPNSKFVYFSLHVIPESSTSTMADTLNELEALYQLSNALPIDWKIVVKANPSMFRTIDTHPVEYYKTMNRIPSVHFMDPAFNSLKIINASSAVASLAGTNLLEGVMFGKPAFCWGDPEFSAIDGLFKFNSSSFIGDVNYKVDERKVAFYIEAILNEGIDFGNENLQGSVKNLDSPDFIKTVENIYDKVFSNISINV